MENFPQHQTTAMKLQTTPPTPEPVAPEATSGVVDCSEVIDENKHTALLVFTITCNH